jgi:hypothetical protein
MKMEHFLTIMTLLTAPALTLWTPVAGTNDIGAEPDPNGMA